MKCVILTFHDVNNYGAVLQAYSLKRHLEEMGNSVVFADAKPDKIKEVYRFNPFRRPFGIKIFARRMITYFFPQLRETISFRCFLRRNMGKTIRADMESFRSIGTEAVIIGSDQVWNDNITGETDVYYLPWLDSSIRKISYAASFGKKVLSDYQKKCISENMDSFYAVSLREPAFIQDIEQLSQKKAVTVVDPVLLNNRNFWTKAAENSKVHPKAESYILYYSLSGDKELVSVAEELSRKLGKKIISIHPTGVKQTVSGKQLYNAGPAEFLYLIKNAAMVVTDSFHGTAFSLIFGKKYYHNVSIADLRVEWLLNNVGVYDNCKEECQGTEILDLSRADNERLESLIRSSAVFLETALK